MGSPATRYPRHVALTHACGHSHHYRMASAKYEAAVRPVAPITICMDCQRAGRSICEFCSGECCPGKKLGGDNEQGCHFFTKGTTTSSGK